MDTHDEEFEVEEILDVGYDEKGRLWYLLKWMGYEETSWTFYRDVRDGCPALLSTFLKDFKTSKREPVELEKTYSFTVEPEESDQDVADDDVADEDVADEDVADEVVEPTSLPNVNTSPASSSLCNDHQCSSASSSHFCAQQHSPAPSSHGQHSSPGSSLHLHYSDEDGGDELENCENSPLQQPSPTPSLQVSEAGSAEFSEVETDDGQPKKVNNFPTESPAWGPYGVRVVEEKGKKRVRCINCKKQGHKIQNCTEPRMKKQKKNKRKKNKKKAHH